MDRTRWLPIGIAALFTLAAAAWMMPPTRPVIPASNASVLHPHARASDPVVPAPDIAATTDVSGALAPPPPPDIPGADAYPPAVPNRTITASPGRPRIRDTPERELADARDQSQAAFRWGYRWAERNGIEDVEDCGVWEGSAREDGCRAFVESDDGPDQSEEDGSRSYP